MKCPNCGAEVTGNVCEYCGSHISKPGEAGCPCCGSTNVRYSQTQQGWYFHETEGFCLDCGNKWSSGNNAGSDPQSNMILWIVGWLVFFPIPLTILIWRAGSLPKPVKYILTALLWLVIACPFVMPWISFLLF